MSTTLIYPFKFRIKDPVIVMAGHYRGSRGKVKALELSEDRTVAVLTVADKDDRPSDPPRSIRVAECALRADKGG